MSNKEAAAAALKRAEAAACRAVAKTRDTPLRRAASTAVGGSCRESQSERPLPVARQSGSASSTSLPWDPLDPKDRVAKFLHASSSLRNADHHLADLRSYEEMFQSFDRQLASVERTRSMIDAVLGGHRDRSQDPCHALAIEPASEVKQRARDRPRQSAAANLPAARPQVQNRDANRAISAKATMSVNPSGSPDTAPAAVPVSAPFVSQVVELRPFRCPAESVGDDCACCLSSIREDDLVLAFPCPARHVFHSGCLLKWLKAAGTKSTCPMCRSWPAQGDRSCVAAEKSVQRRSSRGNSSGDHILKQQLRNRSPANHQDLTQSRTLRR